MMDDAKHVVPSGMDTVTCVAIVTAGLVGFLCSGHAGVILVLSIFTSLWLLCDLMKIYSWSKNQECEVLISSGQMPMRPKLPVHWFALSLIAQSAGILCQLLFGWTVIAGCCLMFFYGGCELVCHLYYYSGTVSENSTTTLPTLSMAGLTVWFVLSGSGSTYGYMDLGRWGGLFWVLMSAILGLVAGKLYLDFLGVKPLGESHAITSTVAGGPEPATKSAAAV
mmetsp:Transcript_18431/g.34528  ORF Transcript_18431/g.34528 Transcript_18431/m.34528 type:complete len:223 (+) Transcript_18431:117-785(+)